MLYSLAFLRLDPAEQVDQHASLLAAEVRQQAVLMCPDEPDAFLEQRCTVWRQGERKGATVLMRCTTIDQRAIDQFVYQRHHIGALDAERPPDRALVDARIGVDDREDTEQHLPDPGPVERARKIVADHGI